MKKTLLAILIVSSACLAIAGSLHVVARHQKNQVYQLVNAGNYDEALMLEASSSTKINLAKKFVFMMGQLNAFIILFGLFVTISARYRLRQHEKIHMIQLNPKFPIPPTSI